MTETSNSIHAALNLCYISSVGASNSWPDIFSGWKISSPCRPEQQSNTLFIEVGEHRTCNIWFCIFLLKDGVSWASMTGRNHRALIRNITICVQIIVDPNKKCVCAAHTPTPGAGPLCRYRMQAGYVRSPRSLQTRIRTTQNRDSCKMTTLCSSCIQLYRPVH